MVEKEFEFSFTRSSFLSVASSASLVLIGVGGLNLDAERVADKC